MPATAHGLQGRFNARTVTGRKCPGVVPVPAEPALPRLWHGPDRSPCFMETVFSGNKGHGGPVTQHVPLRTRVSFYSIFNLHEGLSEPRATVARSSLPLINHFIFGPKSVHLTESFSKFFPGSASRAQSPRAQLFHGHLRQGQYPFWSCQE